MAHKYFLGKSGPDPQISVHHLLSTPASLDSRALPLCQQYYIMYAHMQSQSCVLVVERVNIKWARMSHMSACVFCSLSTYNCRVAVGPEKQDSRLKNTQPWTWYNPMCFYQFKASLDLIWATLLRPKAQPTHEWSQSRCSSASSGMHIPITMPCVTGP